MYLACTLYHVVLCCSFCFITMHFFLVGENRELCMPGAEWWHVHCTRTDVRTWYSTYFSIHHDIYTNFTTYTGNWTAMHIYYSPTQRFKQLFCDPTSLDLTYIPRFEPIAGLFRWWSTRSHVLQQSEDLAQALRLLGPVLWWQNSYQLTLYCAYMMMMCIVQWTLFDRTLSLSHNNLKYHKTTSGTLDDNCRY